MEDSKLSFRLIYVYLNNYYLERHDDLVENMGQELDRLFSIWVILNKSCNFFEIMQHYLQKKKEKTNAFLSCYSGHLLVFPAWQIFLHLLNFSLYKHPFPCSVPVIWHFKIFQRGQVEDSSLPVKFSNCCPQFLSYLYPSSRNKHS